MVYIIIFSILCLITLKNMGQDKNGTLGKAIRREFIISVQKFLSEMQMNVKFHKNFDRDLCQKKTTGERIDDM